MIYFFIFLCVVFLYTLQIQFKIFSNENSKIRILEYHSISTDGFENQVTISKEKFIQQLDYLKQNKYKTLWLSDLEKLKKLPKRSIILTFDDGYLDNYTELFPLLKKYEMKAVCFMVLGRLGQNVDWGGEFADKTQQLMNINQIKETQSHIEYGFHSFKHDNYSKLSFEEIKIDLEKCKKVAEENELELFPALAYTYGGYFRKKDENQKKFFKILEDFGLKYALRIGNRINILPFNSKYELQRIDIQGDESLETFKWKLKLGRIKLF